MPRAARQTIEPTPPEPLSALEAASAERDRADQALARARANLEEAQRREAETKRLLADATESARTAGLALADDPGAEGLLDDAVTEMTRLQHRLRALQEQTVPTAAGVVDSRLAEARSAAETLDHEALREAVRSEVIPADQRLRVAAVAAAEALAECEAVRSRLQAAHGHRPSLSPDYLSWAMPVSLAKLTSAKVTWPAMGGPLIENMIVDADLRGHLCRAFALDPETLT